MKKIIIIFLVFIILCASGFLVYNIINLKKINKDNEKIRQEINNYEKKITEVNTKKTEAEKELDTLKNNHKNKLQEYEKWNQWIKEVKDLMS